jgi:excisionase family DNA binding protein
MIYPVTTVAHRLRVSRETVERMIKRDQLRTVRLTARRVGVTADSLREHLGVEGYLSLFYSPDLAQAYSCLRDALDALAKSCPELAQRAEAALQRLIAEL